VWVGSWRFGKQYETFDIKMGHQAIHESVDKYTRVLRRTWSFGEWRTNQPLAIGTDRGRSAAPIEFGIGDGKQRYLYRKSLVCRFNEKNSTLNCRSNLRLHPLPKLIFTWVCGIKWLPFHCQRNRINKLILMELMWLQSGHRYGLFRALRPPLVLEFRVL
jgi:hypothetical protein